MSDIFSLSKFEFPYEYHFPGQASDEQILFIVRENRSVLHLKLVAIGIVVLVMLGLGAALGMYLGMLFFMVVAILAVLFAGIGWWWVSTLWKKSLAMITTKRLAKIIYTTPFNRHILSLPHEMVVDTGAYTKGFIQALLRLGTFTARSAAASSGTATDDENGQRINKKYFYIENIAIAEDLQHYVTKLHAALRAHPNDIHTFRPFIPHLKGEARKQFMEEWPGYWS